MRVAGAEIAALVMPTSRSQMQLAVLCALGFAAVGVGIARNGKELLGTVCAVAFGAGALLGVRKLLVRPSYALSERGVHYRNGSMRQWIPWDDVLSVSHTTFAGEPALGITAKHGARYEGPGLLGPFFRISRSWGDVSIPVNLLEVDPDELEWTIGKLSREPSARAGIAERGLLGPPV